MRAATAMVVLLFVGGLASADAGPSCKSGSSELWTEGEPQMHHDGPPGSTKLELRAPGHAARTLQREGDWRCLGYSNEKHRYVLIGIFERGAWMVGVAIGLLDEQGKCSESKAVPSDLDIYASVLAPTGHHLALVATQNEVDGGRAGLYALDLVADKLRRLDRAPAAPPLRTEDGLRAFAKDGPSWGWGSSTEGYDELDAGIIVFDAPDKLHATYGKDGPRRRAKQRTVKRWDLTPISLQAR